MTNIVIAGAGFGGLVTALELEKKFKGRKDVSITLVDRHDYHLFNPSLYEIATAEEEFTNIAQLKESIVLPLRKILAGKKIKFVKGEIGEIDRLQKKLKTTSRVLDYDYLILAFGSQTEYFGVEGAKEYSVPLKSLTDAFRLRNAVEFSVAAHKHDSVKQYVRLVVAGGGYTGVELVAELDKLADIVAWKNDYPREKVEVMVVEAANMLVPGFDERASRDIYQRLTDLNVKIKLLSPIFKVEPHFISLVSGEKIPFDVLVWTTGVRAKECSMGQPCECNKRGQLETDEFLRVKGETHIFALGDMACVHGSGQSIVPTTAQAAIAEAKYLAKALPLLMQNKKPTQGFKMDKHPFIVSVGGKWALLKSDHFYFTGFIPYVLRLGANWRYFKSLIGWFKAARYVLFDAEIYSRND